MSNALQAWTMLDGNTMCGRIESQNWGTAHVVRIDGGTCTIDVQRLRPATPEDMRLALAFFANIGK